MDKLRIAEIFTSLQGEGILMGVPSTFIRVSGCNLRCVWCDTPYASWKPEGPTMTLDEIVGEVERGGVLHVVLTGGEPMLFDAVEPLCAALKEKGKHVTIETAGTVFRDLSCDLMSISPKLKNSTPGEEAGLGWATRHEETRRNLEPLKRLVGQYPYQLKFVVDPEGGLDDLAEIEAILDQLPDIAREKTMIMPEGTDAVTLSRRGRMLAPICIEKGFRLCPRLHVELWGNIRGT